MKADSIALIVLGVVILIGAFLFSLNFFIISKNPESQLLCDSHLDSLPLLERIIFKNALVLPVAQSALGLLLVLLGLKKHQSYKKSSKCGDSS